MRWIFIAFLLTVSAVSAQIDSWKVVAKPPELFKSYILDNNESRIDQPYAGWKDQRIAISLIRGGYDSTLKRSYDEIVMLESTDSGATFELLSKFRLDLQLKEYAGRVILESVFYTPKGDVIVFVRGENHRYAFRYDRSNSLWREILSDVDLLYSSDLRMLEHMNAMYLVIGFRLYVSYDEGSSFSLETYYERGYLPDETEFDFGYRKRRGAYSPETKYMESNDLVDWIQYPFWSAACGLAVSAEGVGDDSARVWDLSPMSLPERIGARGFFRELENGAFVATTDPLSPLQTSQDRGKTWSEVQFSGSPKDVDNVWCYQCTHSYVTEEITKTIFMPVVSRMSDAARWPLDGVKDRPAVQTIVCPAPIEGVVQLQISKDTLFGTVLVDVTIDKRYHQANELDGRSTFFWRYRHRQGDGDEWGPWSSTWKFSTGSQGYWTYLGKRESRGDVRSHTIYALDGSYYQTAPLTNAIFRSTDRGYSWDSVAVIQDEKPVVDLWETPGGRILARTGPQFYVVDPLSKTATPEYNGPLNLRIGDKPDGLFASDRDRAYRSYDDGRSWFEFGQSRELIYGMAFDGNENVLFGTGYIEHIYPEIGQRGMFGGLWRYDLISGGFDYITPQSLDVGDRNAVSFSGMFRGNDGRLVVKSNPNCRCFLQSSSDGLEWSPLVYDPIRRTESMESIHDRDSRAVMFYKQNEVVRRLDDGTFEALSEGLRIDGVYSNTPNFNVPERMRDGSLMYASEWHLSSDWSARVVSPKPRSVFQSGSPITFRWSGVRDATSYQVQLIPSDRVIEAGTDTTVTVSDVTPGNYRWRMRAQIGTTFGHWSSVVPFTVTSATGVEEGQRMVVKSTESTTITKDELIRRVSGSTTTVTLYDMAGRTISISDLGDIPRVVVLNENHIIRLVLMLP